MEARKELKIAATIHNQFGKQVTEVRGSEEGGQQQKTQTNSNIKNHTNTPPKTHLPADKDNQRSNRSVYIRCEKNKCNNLLKHL